MNPIATMAMVDTARWRPVVYADTPKTLARFRAFIESKKPEPRKCVLFLFGASYLPDVIQHKDRLSSILLFDDLQNLHNVKKQLEGFDIVDVDDGYPKHLSPSELMEVINKPQRFPEVTLLSQVTKALGQRRPSVLETTNRLPSAEPITESGAQRMLADIKRMLVDDEPAFPVLLDVYVKYLFRIVTRAYVTKEITKKLPAHVKEPWKQALDFADSDVGLAMAKAYHSMCRSSDPDLRASHAVATYSIKAYGGDFLYFTSVLPPYSTCEFLPDVFPNDEKEPQPLVKVVVPKVPEPKAKKAKGKTART